MSKLGFRFAAVPKDRHPEWFEVSLLARTLGLELFFTIYDEKMRVAEVAVAENWAVSLCRLMRVEAKDRLAACRALESLQRHGLIVVFEGKASVLFRADQEPGKRPSSDGQETLKSASREVQEVVKRSPTPGNDSTPVPQKEEIDKKEEREYARAHEGFTDFQSDIRRGSDFMLQATCRSWQRCNDDLALIGAKPESERAIALEAIRRDPWCQANMTRVSPAHVVRKWPHYSAGAPPMQLAKADTSESTKWRSRVQQSTKKLEELKERRAQLQRDSPNYASSLYDIDKAIREETDALERRKRELHALTG